MNHSEPSYYSSVNFSGNLADEVSLLSLRYLSTDIFGL